MKRVFSVLLSIVLVIGIAVPGFAQELRSKSSLPGTSEAAILKKEAASILKNGSKPRGRSARQTGDAYEWSDQVVLTHRVSNGKVTITGCEPFMGEILEIPATIKGLPVVAVDFKTAPVFTTKVKLPASVTSFQYGRAFQTWIGSFEVASGNPVFTVKDGTLYDKKVTKLLYYGGLDRVKFTVPSTVKTIASYAFSNCWLLEELVFPSSVTAMEAKSINTSLVRLTVPPSVKKASNIFATEFYSFAQELYCVKDSAVYKSHKNDAGYYYDTLYAVSLEKTSLSVNRGSAITAKALLQRIQYGAAKNINISGVSWKSSNTTVAKVDSKGKISSVNAGTATITATWKGLPLTCKVTVKGPAITATTLSLPVNTSKTLSVAGGSGTIKWTSSNSRIAKVDSKGKVTGKEAGTATITAIRNGCKSTCKVTVTKPALSSKSKTLMMGANMTLKVSGGSGTIKWKSSNSRIAKVDSKGKVIGIAPGTATITATQNNCKVTCKVTVTKPTLSSSAETIQIGTNKTLKVNGGSGTIKWKSSNSRVAKVDSKGKVTGVSAGTVTITATRNGYKLTCKVTVMQPIKAENSKKMLTGASMTLKMSAGSGTTKWYTSNDKIAKVDSTGKVTALKCGVAIITAKRGSSSTVYQITVQENSVLLAVNTEYMKSQEFGVEPSKVYFSGENLVIEAYVYNGHTTTVNEFDYIVWEIQSNSGKTVAKQQFNHYKINLKSKGYQKYTFTIAAKNVKQKGVKLSSFDSSGYWNFNCGNSEYGYYS